MSDKYQYFSECNRILYLCTIKFGKTPNFRPSNNYLLIVIKIKLSPQNKLCSLINTTYICYHFKVSIGISQLNMLKITISLMWHIIPDRYFGYEIHSINPISMINDAKVLAKVRKIAPRPILFYAFACVMIFRTGVFVSVKMYHFDFFALRLRMRKRYANQVSHWCIPHLWVTYISKVTQQLFKN